MEIFLTIAFIISIGLAMIFFINNLFNKAQLNKYIELYNKECKKTRDLENTVENLEQEIKDIEDAFEVASNLHRFVSVTATNYINKLSTELDNKTNDAGFSEKLLEKSKTNKTQEKFGDNYIVDYSFIQESLIQAAKTKKEEKKKKTFSRSNSSKYKSNNQDDSSSITGFFGALGNSIASAWEDDSLNHSSSNYDSSSSSSYDSSSSSSSSSYDSSSSSSYDSSSSSSFD